jgi:hypothetical protein
MGPEKNYGSKPGWTVDPSRLARLVKQVGGSTEDAPPSFFSSTPAGSSGR